MNLAALSRLTSTRDRRRRGFNGGGRGLIQTHAPAREFGKPSDSLPESQRRRIVQNRRPQCDLEVDKDLKRRSMAHIEMSETTHQTVSRKAPRQQDGRAVTIATINVASLRWYHSFGSGNPGVHRLPLCTQSFQSSLETESRRTGAIQARVLRSRPDIMNWGAMMGQADGELWDGDCGRGVIKIRRTDEAGLAQLQASKSAQKHTAPTVTTGAPPRADGAPGRARSEEERAGSIHVMSPSLQFRLLRLAPLSRLAPGVPRRSQEKDGEGSEPHLVPQSECLAAAGHRSPLPDFVEEGTNDLQIGFVEIVLDFIAHNVHAPWCSRGLRCGKTVVLRASSVPYEPVKHVSRKHLGLMRPGHIFCDRYSTLFRPGALLFTERYLDTSEARSTHIYLIAVMKLSTHLFSRGSARVFAIRIRPVHLSQCSGLQEPLDVKIA
ncbi:hypothetical protein DFH09DRAFT_1091532 [Mycena vulgaris]|nr:hypothetical protein DFH09DRAFT_1091532 [Mycena vulgaris]